LQPLEPKNILRWSAAKTAITCRWLSMLMLMAGLGSGIALADKSDHPPGSGGVQVVIRQLPSSLTATGDDAPPATGPASARPSPKRPSPGVPAPPPSKPAPGPPPVAVGPGSGPFANLRDGGCTVIYPKNDPDSPRLIAEAKAMGRVLNAKRFGDDQWPALERLWNNESGWYPKSCNYQGSGACGITQALPCGRMHDRTTRGQIIWGLDYIANRYKTPNSAWAFWQCTHYCARYPDGPTGKTGASGDPFGTWY
jgi:hypothetical protein